MAVAGMIWAVLSGSYLAVGGGTALLALHWLEQPLDRRDRIVAASYLLLWPVVWFVLGADSLHDLLGR